MIDAHRIVYNNLDSLDLDLTAHLSFDNESGASSSFLNREAISTEVYDGSRQRIHGSKYTDSATPRFTLIKQDFQDFTPEENRRVLSWLTSNDKPSWLEVYQDDSNVLSYKYFCVPTTVEQYKMSNGRVVGYEFEIFSDAPHAWSHKFIYPEVHTTTEELSNNDETNDYLQVYGTKDFTITCNTDEYNKLIYPKVTITFKGENEYFPTDVNPLEDNTYPMVPNVIYLWEDENGVEHLYVSLNGVEDNGRYAIQKLGSTQISQNNPPTDYAYYLIDGYINKLSTDENNTYIWKQIVKVGRAVKISNTYTLNGTSTTKETIIAGGTMDEVIVLDGANKIISGTKSVSTRIIGDDFKWEWISLAYGENNITVIGNCTIKFEWIEPRKVGSL